MKKIIKTSRAPKPIGPYNQAVIAGNYMFISGQIAINPENGDLVTHNIIDETSQVMENLRSILDEASLDFENVVKTTIFLSNMDDFSDVNKVYGSHLNNLTAPARETVQVTKLPAGVNVEISMIAML